MKFTKKMTNAVEPARWVRVSKNTKCGTTNFFIGQDVFKREVREFDNGTLIVCRDLYLGERV